MGSKKKNALMAKVVHSGNQSKNSQKNTESQGWEEKGVPVEG